MDELYNFRDCYFETHSVEEAGKKQSDVAQETENTLKKLEEKEGEHCVYLAALHCIFNSQNIILTIGISVSVFCHRSL